MNALRLTEDGQGVKIPFAMSQGKANNEAFHQMFVEMRRVLREAGWTQRRLCAALGRSESWLSKILHAGRGMDITDLILICEATGLPPSDLLAGYPCPAKRDDEADLVAEKLDGAIPDDVWERLVKLRAKKK